MKPLSQYDEQLGDDLDAARDLYVRTVLTANDEFVSNLPHALDIRDPEAPYTLDEFSITHAAVFDLLDALQSAELQRTVMAERAYAKFRERQRKLREAVTLHVESQRDIEQLREYVAGDTEVVSGP
jgi:hypothetical protein